MSLGISRNYRDELAKFIDGREVVRGFKVLVLQNKKKKICTSRIMKGCSWVLDRDGKEFKSDRKSVELTEREDFLKMVNKGFHFYISEDEAVIAKNYARKGLTVGIFEIKPEDMVAVGDFNKDKECFESFIATKCKYVGTTAHKGYNG